MDSTKRLVYTCHQPDLLPYSGFWYKMAKADVFDLKVWDQYVERGYQRRVRMRERWVNLPMVKGSSHDSIFVKRLQPNAAADLVDQIVKRYRSGGPKPLFWDKRSPQILDGIRSVNTDSLWAFNLQLILLVRDLLGLTTAITLSKPRSEELRGGEGIVSIMKTLGDVPMTYLSGTGARAYMGDCAPFNEAGIPVVWSAHKAVTGDSILSVLLDHEDPLSTVLKEEGSTEECARTHAAAG
jgi:hypothetical protein